jgi:hypothetical protein
MDWWSLDPHNQDQNILTMSAYVTRLGGIYVLGFSPSLFNLLTVLK